MYDTLILKYWNPIKVDELINALSTNLTSDSELVEALIPNQFDLESFQNGIIRQTFTKFCQSTSMCDNQMFCQVI